jgi:uncharacterized protein (DUF58 family)
MMKERRGWRYGLLVMGLAVLALLVMDFNSRMAELRRLTAERELVSARVTQQVQTQNALKQQIAYATSERAVMEWAYQDGRMVRPGDNPVVPVAPAGATPSPTPAQVVTQVTVSNWERWLSLFIGPRTP